MRRRRRAVIDAISPFVDLIELGIPYGDPLADGPTIAAAGQRALDDGMTRRRRARARARRARTRQRADSVLQLRESDRAIRLGTICRGGARRRRARRDRARRSARRTRRVRARLPCRRARDSAARRADDAARTRRDRSPPRATASSYIVSRLGVTSAGREPDVAWIATAVDAPARADEATAGGRFRHLDARARRRGRQGCRRRDHRQRVRRRDRRAQPGRPPRPRARAHTSNRCAPRSVRITAKNPYSS